MAGPVTPVQRRRRPPIVPLPTLIQVVTDLTGDPANPFLAGLACGYTLGDQPTVAKAGPAFKTLVNRSGLTIPWEAAAVRVQNYLLQRIKGVWKRAWVQIQQKYGSYWFVTPQAVQTETQFSAVHQMVQDIIDRSSQPAPRQTRAATARPVTGWRRRSSANNVRQSYQKGFWSTGFTARCPYHGGGPAPSGPEPKSATPACRAPVPYK